MFKRLPRGAYPQFAPTPDRYKLPAVSKTPGMRELGHIDGHRYEACGPTSKATLSNLFTFDDLPNNTERQKQITRLCKKKLGKGKLVISSHGMAWQTKENYYFIF